MGSQWEIKRRVRGIKKVSHKGSPRVSWEEGITSQVKIPNWVPNQERRQLKVKLMV